MLLDAVRTRIPLLIVDVLSFAGTTYEALFGPRPRTPRNEYFDREFEAGDNGTGVWGTDPQLDRWPPPRPAVPGPDADAGENPTTDAEPLATDSGVTIGPNEPSVIAEDDLAKFWHGISVFVKRFLHPVIKKTRRSAGRQIGDRLVACATGDFRFSREPIDIDRELYRHNIYELPGRFEEMGKLLAEHGALNDHLVILDILEGLNICWEDEQAEQEQNFPIENAFWPFTFAARFFAAVTFEKHFLRRFVEGLWTLAHSQMDSAHDVLHHVSEFLVEMRPEKSAARYAFDRFHKDEIIEEIRKVWRTRLFQTVFPEEKEKEEQRERDKAAGIPVDETDAASAASSLSEDEYQGDPGEESDSSGTFMTDGSEFSTDGDGSEGGDWDDGWDDGGGSDFDGSIVDDDEDFGAPLGPYFDHEQDHDEHHPAFINDSSAEEDGGDGDGSGSGNESDNRSWVTDEDASVADIEELDD